MLIMYHDDPKKTAGPTTADVHESNVDAMLAVGWYTKEDATEGAESGEQTAKEDATEGAESGRAKKAKK